MACEYKPGRISSRCLLHTRYGIITVYGEVGEIIARACTSNYINETL